MATLHTENYRNESIEVISEEDGNLIACYAGAYTTEGISGFKDVADITAYARRCIDMVLEEEATA